jgi:hypothetical protein
MPDKSKNSRRRKIDIVREDERRKVLGSLPVPVPVLRALFSYVNSQLLSSECDTTLRHTLNFIRANGLPEEAVIGWLKHNHGYCDCETLWNSEEVVDGAVPGYRNIKPSTELS